MFISLDKNNKRTTIYEALKSPKEKYSCPCCKGELLIRDGSVNVSHFAHKTLLDCDDFSHDMSKWHRKWQEQFPEKYREIIIEYHGEKHIADICIGDIVLEIQHSPISASEFERRNRFYGNAGYYVIWIFDTIEQEEEGRIFLLDEVHNGYNHGGKYQWNYASKTFTYFTPQYDKDVTILFNGYDTDFDENHNGYLERVTWAIPEPDDCPNFKKFITSYYPGNINQLIKYMQNKSDKKEAFNEFKIKYEKPIVTKLYINDGYEDDSFWYKDIVDFFPWKDRDIPVFYTFKFSNSYENVRRRGFMDDITKFYKANILYNGYVIIPCNNWLTSNEFSNTSKFFYYAGYRTIWIFNLINEVKNKEIIYCTDKIYDGKLRKVYRNKETSHMAKTFKYYSPKNNTYDTLVFFQTKDLNNDVYLEKLAWASRNSKDEKKDFEIFFTTPAFKNIPYLKSFLEKNPYDIDPVYELL